jgi:hypothetical protein
METKVIRIEIKFTRTTLAVLLGSILLLSGLIIVGVVSAQNPDPEIGLVPLPPGAEEALSAGNATTLGALAVSSVVSPSISYQGRLTDPDGNPLSGDYDMTFQLWDAETDGDMVGSAINKTGVTVEDGLFDVKLDVNPDDFNGQELWLGVTVGGETLEPTQQIMPAPYALSLRPGAIISGTRSYVELNRYMGGWIPGEAGVYAKVKPSDALGFGMWGDGSFAGVWGSTDDGYGVYATSSVTGTAIFAAGDVKQSLAGDGLVKAAVHAFCGTTSSIKRSFNNAGSTEITIAGVANGECTIDFGFDINERFWVAMAEQNAPRFTNCALNSSDDEKLDCYRYDATGSAIGGDIMVLLY